MLTFSKFISNSCASQKGRLSTDSKQPFMNSVLKIKAILGTFTFVCIALWTGTCETEICTSIRNRNWIWWNLRFYCFEGIEHWELATVTGNYHMRSLLMNRIPQCAIVRSRCPRYTSNEERQDVTGHSTSITFVCRWTWSFASRSAIAAAVYLALWSSQPNCIKLFRCAYACTWCRLSESLFTCVWCGVTLVSSISNAIRWIINFCSSSTVAKMDGVF